MEAYREKCRRIRDMPPKLQGWEIYNPDTDFGRAKIRKMFKDYLPVLGLDYLLEDIENPLPGWSEQQKEVVRQILLSEYQKTLRSRGS